MNAVTREGSPLASMLPSRCAANRVGPVDRGSPVGEHLHRLKGRQGDLVNIDEGAAAACAGAALGQTPAVEQHQGRQVAQRKLRSAGSGGAAGNVAVGGPEITAAREAGHARLHDFGLPVIQDLRPNEGPVTALSSCFPQIKTELVLVLSCDVPQIKTQDLQVLLNTVKPDLDMTMFSFQNRALPLVAVYGRSSFTAFEAAFQHSERKLFNVLKKLKTQTIVFDGDGGLENVNTRTEYEEISQRNSEKNLTIKRSSKKRQPIRQESAPPFGGQGGF